MKTICIENISISIPEDWIDASADFGVPTFTKSFNGVGALQFSLASYREGGVPKIDSNALRQMLKDFGRAKNLVEASSTLCLEQGMNLFASKSFISKGKIIKVWYVSNGIDLVLATYICEEKEENIELFEYEMIIKSIKFL